MSLPANWRTLDWAINIYVCERGTPDGRAHVMTTVDVDVGVTPFLASCPQCNGKMRSQFYPSARPIPDWVPAPTEEWYKPTPEEVTHLDAYSLQHVAMGGLLRRKWTGKTPVPNEFGPKKKEGA